MSMKDFLFTSESVTEGHPDKVADQISDAILDAIIADDPECRVACETMVTTGMAIVAGEITTSTYVDIPEIVRNTIKDIGYTDAKMGFDYETCAVLTSIDKQSPDISQGVTLGQGLHKEQGAGDQGLMFGYACDETYPEFMPLSIMLAHKLCARLADIRKKGIVTFLRPDGKSQVTIRYVDREPVAVDSIVIAAQHTDDVRYEHLREVIIKEVIKKVIKKEFLKETKFYVNETGRFVIGGPQGDCGLTGRKIIVDSYGGWGSHGGGCFSGKDPSKVDRSGSYMARYVAKNIVAAKLARRCEIQVAYVIGRAEPLSVMIDTNGTSRIPHDKIAELVRKYFDFRPASIIKRLNLLRPIYKYTAAYGHFGRREFPWESLDMVDTLREAAGFDT